MQKGDGLLSPFCIYIKIPIVLIQKCHQIEFLLKFWR